MNLPAVCTGRERYFADKFEEIYINTNQIIMCVNDRAFNKN